MKRYGNLYEKIYDKNNLRLAHKKARKDKTHYKSVRKVDNNVEYYIDGIHDMLKNKTYIVGDYTCKTISEHGKERLIMKLPYYPDRIIQWAVMLQLEKYFVNNLCYHSCASIPYAGNVRVHKLITRYMSLYDYDYCLDIDIKKFYPNVDKQILKFMLRRKFKDKDLLWLLDSIIDSSPKDENSIKDEYIRGIPIGSYLSQYLANFYLSYFDHWLKEEKKCKAVVRYMDNIIILSNSKSELHRLKLEIETYLWNNLHLKLKENWQVYNINDRPIDFIGYRYGKDFVLLRKETTKRFIKLCNSIESKNHCTEKEYRALTAYFGALKWCDSKHLWYKYYDKIKFILKRENYNLKFISKDHISGLVR